MEAQVAGDSMPREWLTPVRKDFAPAFFFLRSAADQLAQYVVQDATGLEVLDLIQRVDPA